MSIVLILVFLELKTFLIEGNMLFCQVYDQGCSFITFWDSFLRAMRVLVRHTEMCTCSTIPAPGNMPCKALSLWSEMRWASDSGNESHPARRYVAVAALQLWCTTYQVWVLCLLRQLDSTGNTIWNDRVLVKELGEHMLPEQLLKGMLMKLHGVSKWCNSCKRKASLLLNKRL